MNLRNGKIMVVLLITILALTLTGCVQGSMHIELNEDASGKLIATVAYSDEMDGEINDSFMDFGNESDADLGTIIISEEIEYEDNGVIYTGARTEVIFDNIEDMIKYTEAEDIKLEQVSDNMVRLTYILNSSDEGDEDEMLDMSLAMLQAFGGKINFEIKPNFEVVNHNAHNVVDGVYTWNLLTGDVKTAFIEYEGKLSDEESNIELTFDYSRKGIEEKLKLDVNDIDYHGKALEKLGLLKGDGYGLALDKQLTRAEGAVLFSRVIGLDKQVKRFKEENPEYVSGFTDVPEWATDTVDILQYKGLVAGVSDTLFDANATMSETHYATFMLRALEVEGEYKWDTAAQYMKDNGFYENDSIDYNKILMEPFNRRGAAYMTYNALFVENNRTGVTLIEDVFK